MRYDLIASDRLNISVFNQWNKIIGFALQEKKFTRFCLVDGVIE